MVKRLNFKKHDSGSVQEGSYVVLRRPKMGEMDAIMAEAKSLNGASEEERNAANLKASLDLISKLIVEWNWIDDDGKELPLPKVNPEVMNELSDEEVAFLSGLLNPNKEEQAEAKNAPPG